MIDLISDLTQMGYRVAFCPGLSGMIRLEFTLEGEEYPNSENGSYYQQNHLGYPECPTQILEMAVRGCLAKFIAEQI